jgi:uncharacterized membrane protein YccC
MTRAPSTKLLWEMVTRLQRDRIAPWIGLRNAIGVGLPLAVGVAAGSIPMGLAVAVGALNVAFSDSAEPYSIRGWRMLAASVLVGFALAVGEAVGAYPAADIAVTIAWAFAAGLLVALSQNAADLGAVSLVTLLVYSAVPATPERAVLAGLLAFAGGLLETGLALAAWPVRRYVPQRNALASLFTELARIAETPVNALTAPPASAESQGAQQVLAALHRDHSIQGERYRALLSQAERIRLSLLMLARLRVRLNREREGEAGCECKALDRFFEISVEVLTWAAEVLAGRRSLAAESPGVDELPGLAESLRRANPRRSPPMEAMLDDARHQMDALAGQLRSVLDLAGSATPEGLTAFARREARRPWRLRLIGTVATLRANLRFESVAFRHAVRLAVCIGLAEMIAHTFALRRSYWMPMTIAIVLKPDFGATFSRGFLRLAGTFVGLVSTTVMFHLFPSTHWREVLLIFTLMFLLRSFGPANYGIVAVTVTALVVELLSLAGIPAREVMPARGINTLAGGAIALAAYALWPTWERRHVAEAMAKMLDAYREYFHTIRESYIHPGGSWAHELDRTRQAARLARSNLEASAERLHAEPGTPAEITGMAGGILANSHRLVHAIMALEAGLASSRPAPARAAFAPFANGVEFTLYYLAAALRRSPMKAEHLPDLREAHHELASSGEPLTERYALVNVETDRMTNSLNTVAGEILRFVAAG